MKMHVGKILFITFIIIQCTSSQLKFGVDVYSRYIWRGLDYGNSPSVQPLLSYTSGGFTVGTWGAYSTGVSGVDTVSGSGKAFSEHDLFASYGISTGSGTFSLFYTDYFYPSNGLRYFNFTKNGGAHVLEFGAGWTGTESLPFSVTAYYNFHNDPDNSVYVQCGYNYSSELYTANIFAAFTPGKSAWYGSRKADLINVGVSGTKTLSVSDKLSIPLTVSYIVNPHVEQSYLIVGVSF